MKKTTVFLLCVLIMTMVVLTACKPAQPTVKGEEILPSPEEVEISEELNDLNDLDALAEEFDEDITFEEIENVELE
jgi:hypothetical protein